jgi:hypothetical protein
MTRVSKTVTVSAALVLSLFTALTPAKNKNPIPTIPVGKSAAVLWRNPSDITSRDLFYGPGGKAHEPHGPFTFEKEDKNGTNPKFDVVDQDGVKWRVKLGPEARPETVASRLVWSVGYFANEDYFLPVLQVQNMQRLHRGKSLVSKDGTMHNVRMKRHLADEKKIGEWSWSKAPFRDTQEWYRLRVLMAIMNNWDLKDINNAVYQSKSEPLEERYLVSDLGLVWLGRHIPRTDARWMGQQLAKLSPKQIRDAFRAGGYSAQEVEELSTTLERRIAELEKL